MSKPFFSVVLPTRNRAKLLPFAITSVLNQTFDDYELIVSDNFSFDETERAAKSINDKRIKYFRSEKSLSLAESLSFALSHAKGEYISFLSDDDAYPKIFLERLFNVIETESSDLVSCRMTPFYGLDAFAYGRNIAKNSLVVQQFNRKNYVLSSEEAVNFLFAKFRLSSKVNKYPAIDIPGLVNSAYRSSLIEKVKKRVPKIFPIIASDVYSSALFLNAANKYCYLNEPLYLHTVWEESATSGKEPFFEKFPEEQKLNYVPLKKLLSMPNYLTNTISRAKHDWGQDFQKVSLDWKQYFISSYGEIMYLQRNKTDVSGHLEEYERELSKQDAETQKAVRDALPGGSKIQNVIKNKLKNSAPIKLIDRLRYRAIRVVGGFDDIAECAKTIDEEFLNKYSEK